MISPSKRRGAASSRNNNNSMTRPVKKRNKLNKEDNNNDSSSSSLRLLDLHRLLHVMETTNSSRSTDPPEHVSPHDLRLRADLLREQFEQLVETDDTAAAAQAQRLQARVEAACQAAWQQAAALQQSTATTTEEDPVPKIFFSPTAEEPTTTKPNTTSRRTSRSPKKPPAAAVAATKSSPQKATNKKATTQKQQQQATATPSAAALQQQQRAAVEEAVADMAHQLKQQTSQIHTTLQNQTHHLLDDMHEAATDNVHAVTDLARDVTTTQHAGGWRRTVGTWTLLLTVVAAFLACVLTIGTLPKRPGACLFFCSQNQQFCRTLANGPRECLDHNVSSSAKAAPSAANEKEEPEREQPSVKEEDGVVQGGQQQQPEAGNTVPPEEPQDDSSSSSLEGHFHAARAAAAAGDFKALRRQLKQFPALLDYASTSDDNGTTLLAEAARHGKTECLRVLVRLGADPGWRTAADHHHPTALELARAHLPAHHPTVVLLEQYTAERQPREEEAPQENQVAGNEPECQVGMDGECLTTTTADAVVEEETPAEEASPAMPTVVDAEAVREEALREYQAMQQQHPERSVQKDVDVLPPPIPSEEEEEEEARLDFGPWEVRRAAQEGNREQLAGYVAAASSTGHRHHILYEPDENGWNALHLAVRAGHGDIVEQLLLRSSRVVADALLRAETNSGRTALDLAVLEFGPDAELTRWLAELAEQKVVGRRE